MEGWNRRNYFSYVVHHLEISLSNRSMSFLPYQFISKSGSRSEANFVNMLLINEVQIRMHRDLVLLFCIRTEDFVARCSLTTSKGKRRNHFSVQTSEEEINKDQIRSDVLRNFLKMNYLISLQNFHVLFKFYNSTLVPLA